ncbi:MAG: methyltransferase domain-containing protein [Planctomycetaceae bacterium]|jgi:SAM-dependent methyltransferase|nr:methyltransferase domain-containing protein [Phycisphaerales bacterium]MCE2652266.1 methyltransferase domain-containing protein [Planctomycetaceae bacterium]
MNATPETAHAPPPRPYVLGTGDDELGRLGLQHRLWSDAAHEAWKLARIGPGQHVLDVGCGPGYASFDLAQLVTSTGSVLGVDESPAFISWLTSQADARGLPQLSGLVADAHHLASAVARPAAFDAAYIRWVLCFVKNPARVIHDTASLLRPGGRLVIHDYFNYTSMTMAPRRASHDAAVAATARSWRERGGDPDVMARVPAMLAEAGLNLTHLAIHQRHARGNPSGPPEAMFAWPDVWWRTYAPKLVAMGYLAQADCDQLLRDLDAVRTSATDFIVVPPVYQIIAEKPAR